MKRIVLTFIFGFIFGMLVQYAMPIEVHAEQPLSNYTVARASPGDWISEEQIEVYNDQIVIKVDNPQWSRFLGTHSMDPLLDDTSNGLELIPESKDQLRIGDVISYQTSKGVIIHRIIGIGNDEQGWYAIVKGDNNHVPDPVKVRFENIRRVLIGVIY